MNERGRLAEMELLFKALADRTRLRLLNLMGDDEICVCFLVEALKISQPKISRHLAYLKKAGVVAARREGKWMHYRVIEPADADAAQVIKDVRAWLSRQSDMKRDRERLVSVCCAVRLPVRLQNAPRPVSLAT